MTHKVGIAIGKFMPLHKGHELMIRFAAANLDHLIILVSGKLSDSMCLLKRHSWVETFVLNEGISNVSVKVHIDDSPTPINVDENGTVLDKDFQFYWANEISKHIGVTHIVSSDMYGRVLADLMSLKWMPVDPEREMISISATQIRSEPQKYFEYISDGAKPYFVRKIAFVGAESTGKSRVTRLFSNMWNTHFANEYGRSLTLERKENFTKEDFWDIVEGQQTLIDLADRRNVKDGKFITLVDTEAYVTYLYSKIYLGEYIPEILEYAKMQHIDKYLVLAPNTKWVDDGTRIMDDEQERIEFHENLVQLLKENGESYSVIDDPFFSNRQERISKIIFR